MRVVIAGAGDVGYRVARDLITRGHGVSLIDSDPVAVKRAQTLDAQVIRGHAASPKLLVEQSGLAEADLFIGVTGDDAVNLLGYLFVGADEPGCLDGADANDDGAVDIGDPILILGYLFTDGIAPSEPFEKCGTDPTADSITCEVPPAGC